MGDSNKMEKQEETGETPFSDLPKKVRRRMIRRDVLFALCALLVFLGLSMALDLKGAESDAYSAAAVYTGFYEEERDSMDVLFLGSSNAYCAFSPNELESRTGLSSWNLASSQQSIFTSYYWLREALSRQKPKVVVLDAYYLYFTLGNEGSLHKAFDFMLPTKVKQEAVHRLTLLDPDTYQAVDFSLPLLRYHTRWKEMTAEELFGSKSLPALLQNTSERGYCPRTDEMGDCTYMPLSPDGSVLYTSLETKDGQPYDMMETGRITDLARYYFGEIADLCAKNGIRLILVKTPILWWSEPMLESASALAQENGVPFLDLNEENAIAAMGYDYETDAADHLHANESGAKKITDYLAPVLVQAAQ